jgi:hypothetical protein
MTAWLSNRVWLIAATLATVIGSYLAVMVNRYGQIGGDGPNFWGFRIFFWAAVGYLGVRAPTSMNTVKPSRTTWSRWAWAL